MKKVLGFVAASTALLSATPAMADASTTLGNSDSGTTTATIDVICPLIVNADGDTFDFGRVAVGAAGGSMTFAGSLSTTGQVTQFGTPNTNVVTFNLSGEPGFAFTDSSSASVVSAPTGAAPATISTGIFGGTNSFAGDRNNTDAACASQGRNIRANITLPGGVQPGVYNWQITYTATYQ